MALRQLLDTRTDEPRTLGESVYVKLRDSIVGNRLKPETRLCEKEVAEALRVSRTPVREALVRLAAEGFVRMLTHRESVVRGIDSREVEDIFEFMRVMDGFAFDALTRVISKHTLSDVRDLTFRMEKAYNGHRLTSYLKLNGDIHRTLWRDLPNRYIRGELERCLLQVERSLYSLDPGLEFGPGFDEAMGHHRDMIRLIENRDRDGLRNLVRSHWTPPLP